MPDVPVVGVDQSGNHKVLRRLQQEGRLVLVQAHTLEQSFKDTGDQAKAFRLGISTLDGPDRLAGENFHAVQRII